MIKEIPIKTKKRNEMQDITAQIQEAVKESPAENGLVVVYNPHTTAAVTINEGADPAVRSDVLDALMEHFPHGADYKHTEGNADAHIKSSLVGSDRLIPFKNSKLMLGSWQKIFFCEFDGPRTRRVVVAVIPV